MRDIYHHLLMHSPEFVQRTDEDLRECSDLLGSGAFAITSALTLIGNLALDATLSEGYGGDDAMRDMKLLGCALSHLPRMAQALEQNAATAQYVLSQRREVSQ